MTIKLELQHDPNQSDEVTLAAFKTKPSFVSTSVLDIYGQKIENSPFDYQATIEVLEQTTKKIQSGDLTRLEEMLYNQALALEAIFAKTIQRANQCELTTNYQMQMNIALKAQNQSRQTLMALIDLKQPSNTTFVKQANIAQGHQQVNNSTEIITLPQNELLEKTNEQPWMDRGKKTKAEGVNSELEAMESVYRSKDTGR